MRHLHGALPHDLNFHRLLHPGRRLDGLREGDSIAQRLDRQRLIVRLVGANDVLWRMPEAMATTNGESVGARRIRRELNKEIPGLTLLRTDFDDAWADRCRDDEFQVLRGERDGLAALVISLRVFHAWVHLPILRWPSISEYARHF